MKLLVEIPSSYSPERTYILSVIFDQFYGTDYNVRRAERSDTRITAGDEETEILIPDSLFATSPGEWLKPSSLPRQPLWQWDTGGLGLAIPLLSPLVPVPYGDPSISPVQEHSSRLTLPIDVFGSCFFMLTRYEEVVRQERDKRGRFPAKASIAHQENFLSRPIVNEYIEILWACIKHLWPSVVRRPRKYRVRLTHDVDLPLSCLGSSYTLFGRSCLGDILKRRNIALLKERLRSHFEASRGIHERDPYNSFAFIMDTSERHGLQSAFYFIAGIKPETFKSHYDVGHWWVKELIRQIHTRGHEIGWHPAFGTYTDYDQAEGEYVRLREVCSQFGIQQEQWGGRQHGLQWSNPETARIWNKLGLSYDSTLTFAEEPGFRCGVCYEYPFFDLIDRKILALRERPLIVMDTSYYSYLRYGLDDSFDSIVGLSRVCKKFGGDFVGLWHNSKLASPERKLWYEDIVKHLS